MLPLDQRKENVLIEDEIKRSYLDYAMSVIIGRALPEVRDGLKPVHRRVLFAMHELKNDFNKAYKKSARVVGDVIGKYHPHGDTAVYDTIVRMAQDFAMRYGLVDGQGNFGSVDGDAPAAMRYTEVRMSKLAHAFLDDLEKETVEFQDNYDGSMREPMVLPTKVPNLLVNGSSGIAVGMATNIPPHNLAEVANAVVAVLDDPAISLEALMRIIPGPDFPTHGFIYGRQGIREAYSTGRGSIQIRARANIETHARTKKTAIIVTELPYQVNKARLLERVAELVKDKKIDGITDIRDESDRDGMRVVLEIRRDAQPQVVLNQLFKFTQMQTSFGIHLLAIVNNRPEQLTLKQILNLFINHRREIILKRTVFDLKKAEARAHVLEGLKVALENLDLTIELIRAAKNTAEARISLMTKLNLSEIQANAILEMRLQRLTGLEQNKILDEYRQVLEEIANLRSILGSEERVRHIIRQETMELAAAWSEGRRTEIVSQSEEIDLEDIIAEEEMAVTLTRGGYIKRAPISLYRAQRRGGKGKIAMTTKEEDFVTSLFVASTHSYLLILTNLGRLYWLKVHELPQAGRATKGKAIVNLVNLQAGEDVASILPVREFTEGRYVVLATQKGIIKKVDLMSFSRPRAGGIIAAQIGDDDRLVAASLTDGQMDIFLATAQGKAIRFKEEQVRAMGRTAAGVKGIDVSDDDRVVSMEAVAGSPTLLSVVENGYGKRTRLDEYPLHHRGGKGVITMKTSERNGLVVATLVVDDADELMLITSFGKIVRTKVSGISVLGRNTQGVKLIDVAAGETLVAVDRMAESDQDEETAQPTLAFEDGVEELLEENGDDQA